MKDHTNATTGEKTAKATPKSSVDTLEKKTLSVVQAGEIYFGLKKDASYNAAKRGQIPVIRLGRTLRVPVVLLEKMLLDAGK
jgi:hypothetical protein